MTTELAVQESNAPALPTAPTNPAIVALMAHRDAMSAAHELAVALCSSDLVPAMYKGKPGNGAAAILYGAELGLNPIQSLQQIFVVHGSPAVYARTMVALVKRNGYSVATQSSTDDAVTVVGQAPDGSTETSTWSIARAKKAGYLTNKKYETDPQAMLYAKAASEVCRKLAPEVLLGIAYSREELELESPPVRVKSERVGAAGGVSVRVKSERVGAAGGVSGLKAAVGLARPVDDVDGVVDDESVAEGLASDKATEDIPSNVTPMNAGQKKALQSLFRKSVMSDAEQQAWLGNLFNSDDLQLDELTSDQAAAAIAELQQ
jgi:hypothetical protein